MTVLQYPTRTKAKKTHTCNLCLHKIEIGSLYMKSSYKEDVVYTWKTHTWCQEIAEKLKMHKDREGVGSNEFTNDIHEEYSNLTPIIGNPKFNEILQCVLNHHSIKYS